MTESPAPYTGLRARLRQRSPIKATFLDLGSPVSAEISARSGFDCVIVDLEHGVGDEQIARAQIRAVDGWAAAIVRAPDGPGQVARMLDAGAEGIVFPQIASAAEAAEAALSVRYAGRRGVFGMARSAGFGSHTDTWRADTDARNACIIQIERAAALAELDAIAALDDVDGLLIGPMDLSNDLGCPPDLEAEPLRGATRAAAAAARRHGKAAGLYLGGGADAPEWVAAGFTMLASSVETQLVRAASTAAAARLDDAFGRM